MSNFASPVSVASTRRGGGGGGGTTTTSAKYRPGRGALTRASTVGDVAGEHAALVQAMSQSYVAEDQQDLARQRSPMRNPAARSTASTGGTRWSSSLATGDLLNLDHSPDLQRYASAGPKREQQPRESHAQYSFSRHAAVAAPLWPRTRWDSLHDEVAICDAATSHGVLPESVVYPAWDAADADHPVPSANSDTSPPRNPAVRDPARRKLRDWEPGALKRHLLAHAPPQTHHQQQPQQSAAVPPGSSKDPFSNVETRRIAAVMSPVKGATVRNGDGNPALPPGTPGGFSDALPPGTLNLAPRAKKAKDTDKTAVSASEKKSRAARDDPSQLPVHARVARTMTKRDQPGACVLREAGAPLPMAVLGTVVEELRRSRVGPDSRPGEGIPADTIIDTLDWRDVRMPRLDGTTGRPVPTTNQRPDPATTVHPLVQAVSRLVVPGDVDIRAHRISTVHLDGCDLFDSDVAALAELLRSPACTLVHVTLQGNWISPTGGDTLKKVIKYNTKLRTLDVTGNEWMALPDFDPSGADVLRIIRERLDNNSRGVSNLSAVKRLMN